MTRPLPLLVVLALLLLPAPACRSARHTASLGGVYVTGGIAAPVRAAQDFLTGHPDLLAALGSPVTFDGMGADIRPNLGQATVDTLARGPAGAGPARVALVEANGRWRAVSGELALGERTVALGPR